MQLSSEISKIAIAFQKARSYRMGMSKTEVRARATHALHVPALYPIQRRLTAACLTRHPHCWTGTEYETHLGNLTIRWVYASEARTQGARVQGADRVEIRWMSHTALYNQRQLLLARAVVCSEVLQQGLPTRIG